MMNSRKRKLLRNRCNSYMKLYVNCGWKQFQSWWSSLAVKLCYLSGSEGKAWKIQDLNGTPTLISAIPVQWLSRGPSQGSKDARCSWYWAKLQILFCPLKRQGLETTDENRIAVFFLWYLEIVNLIKQNNTFSVSHWTGLITRKRLQLQSCLRRNKMFFENHRFR